MTASQAWRAFVAAMDSSAAGQGYRTQLESWQSRSWPANSSALAPAPIPELKFVPRFRKARPPRPPSARRSLFPKRSSALPRVRTPPIRALVLLGTSLQRLRPLAPALLAQSQAQWTAQSPTRPLVQPPLQPLVQYMSAKEMLAARAQFRSRRFLAPAQL